MSGIREVQDLTHRRGLANFPHGLTWMENSRPDNLTLAVKFGVEPDVQVENTQFRNLNL